MSSRSRALVTLLVAGAFLVIGGTGVLLYTRPHANLTAAISGPAPVSGVPVYWVFRTLCIGRIRSSAEVGNRTRTSDSALRGLNAE